MSARERNELDDYSDLMDGVGIHNAKPPVDPDAEWLQQQQPSAFQAAADAGCFDEVDPDKEAIHEILLAQEYEGELLADCAAVSLGDTLRQIAVDAYVETRSKPRSLWSAWNEMHGDGKAQARLDRLGYVDYYPGAKR